MTKRYFLPIVLIGCVLLIANNVWAADDVKVEKSYGNQRYLYSVPSTSSGPMQYSKFPLKIEKIYNAPFDKVWQGVLRLAEANNGKTIVSDKSSGLIVFKYDEKLTYIYKDSIVNLFDRKIEAPPLNIYFNVLIKQSSDSSKTIVYATYFIPKINQQLKYYDVDFFEKLDKLI